VSAERKPGQVYTPDSGEHKGHRVRVLSNDTRKETLPGNVVRHTLVRCETCLLSWTFGQDAT
jgi:hypothetical protein